MARLLELPLELLPVIFDFVLKPQHIFTLCLVNKTFNKFATRLLYRRVFIFAWHTAAKSKVILLFQTLSKCSCLARYVEKLEIRDFPKALSAHDHSEILQMCNQGIRNCVNLRSCTWTRDGSIQSTMLESLAGCPQLRELEINGNDSGYDPVLLTRFSRLSKISLIMPSAHVLDILPTWMSITGDTLQNLTIVCKASTLVTDMFLVDVALYLHGLECLYITGCPRVTEVGIEAIASASKNGLVELGIESLSQVFDMSSFKTKCLHTRAFRRLKAITLTVHINMPLEKWTRDVGDLLFSAPLEALSIYSTTTLIWTPIADEFWKDMVLRHGQRLRKFSVHRMQIGLAALEVVCTQCPLLEQLFVVIDKSEINDAARLFALAKNLRTLHINFPRNEFWPLTLCMLMQRAESIVPICPSTLVHIGCSTRVWQIKRTVREDENGEKCVVRTLAPQETPDIPEQFLVVRT